MAAPSEAGTRAGGGAGSLLPIRIKLPSSLGVPPNLDDLRRLQATTENSLRHLLRTNTELRAELSVAHDDDYAQAVVENDAVVATKFAKLKEINRLIKVITQYEGRPGSLLFVPEEEWTAADDAAVEAAVAAEAQEEAATVSNAAQSASAAQHSTLNAARADENEGLSL